MVEVQSNLLTGLPTRLMMPLGCLLCCRQRSQGALSALDFGHERTLSVGAPGVAIQGQRSGEPQGSVAAHASVIVAALDAVLSGF